MKASLPSAPPRRLLVRGVNWLGDAVMTTPALQRLREALPQTHITLLTPAKLADLWHQHPALDDVLAFAPEDGIWSVAARLRAGHFDTALVLPNSPRSAIESWLAGIPQRIGYARPWRNLFLTHAIPERLGRVVMRKRSVAEIQRLIAVNPAASAPAQSMVATDRSTADLDATSVHQTLEYLHLVAVLGASSEPIAPRLEVTEAEVAGVAAKFGLPPGTRWLGLNPGAEYGPAKRWPKASFIAAANAIHARTGCGLVLFGGRADAPLVAEICSALRVEPALVRDLSGRTSLRELCAALKICRVLLTNDTGPMHVAAAVGTPVVVPFGSTSPELTGPGLPGAREHHLLRAGAPCSPCFLRECPIDFRCLTGLTPERVAEAVIECLGEGALEPAARVKQN